MLRRSTDTHSLRHRVAASHVPLATTTALFFVAYLLSRDSFSHHESVRAGELTEQQKSSGDLSQCFYEAPEPFARHGTAEGSLRS